jgi:hypothetical protein
MPPDNTAAEHPPGNDPIKPFFAFDLGTPDSADQETSAPGRHQIGQVVAGWRLERVIAAGETASVFQVSPHNDTGEPAAMKLFAASTSLRRFRLHASMLSELRHPNLVRVREWGIEPKGTPYLVMDLVRGETFDAWIKRAAPPATSVIEIIAQVADAVGSAHLDAGLVHRDLKPSNVMVESDASGTTPSARVIDFGVALLVDREGAAPDSLATGGGAIVGTLAYMAPEQLYAGTRPVDARADVYALGVMLFEALASNRPVDTDGLSFVEAARLKEATGFGGREIARRAARAGHPVARGIADVIAAALAPDPEDRPANGRLLAADLRRAIAGEQPLHKKPGVVRRVQRFLQKERRLASVIFAFAIVAIVSAIAIAGLAIRAETARRAEQAQTDRLIAMVKTWTQGAFLRSFQTPGSEAAMIPVTESVIKALEEASSVRPMDIDLLDQLSLAYAQLASVVGTPVGRSLGDEARARALHDLSIDAATKSAELYRVQRPAEADLARLSIANSIKRRVSVTPDAADRRVLLARALSISESVYALLPTRDDVVVGHVGTLGMCAENEPDAVNRLALLDQAERLLTKQLQTSKRTAQLKHQIMILRLTLAGELAKSDPERAARELAAARELLTERIKTLAPETQESGGPPLDPKVPVQAMLSRLLARTTMLEAQIAAGEGRWADALRLSEQATHATASLARADPTSGPSAFDHATRLRERAELLLEAGSRSDLGTEERAELRELASAAAREAILVIESFMPERPRTYVEEAEIERCRGVLNQAG